MRQIIYVSCMALLLGLIVSTDWLYAAEPSDRAQMEGLIQDRRKMVEQGATRQDVAEITGKIQTLHKKVQPPIGKFGMTPPDQMNPAMAQRNFFGQEMMAAKQKIDQLMRERNALVARQGDPEEIARLGREIDETRRSVLDLIRNASQTVRPPVGAQPAAAPKKSSDEPEPAPAA
jgi:hypothetical protein